MLKEGDVRIPKMKQEQVAGATMVDRREAIETWFGWDTYDMTFLRYANRFDEWDSFGGGWACPCFIRKTIFNSHVLRQF